LRTGSPSADRSGRHDDVGEDLRDAGADDAVARGQHAPDCASLKPSFSIVMQNGQAVATVEAPVSSA
jgi:hypothetical protein